MRSPIILDGALENRAELQIGANLLVEQVHELTDLLFGNRGSIFHIDVHWFDPLRLQTIA
jgi:hypothetical protein